MTSSAETRGRLSSSWERGSLPLARAAALLGGAAYALLAYGQIHGQVSVLDEGLYLYKGLLFARGLYWPFQDFGPLTNHMPLSFLIPGWIQVLFGPGLATGRAFAWVTGLMLLLGLWVATRRLAGPWWAASAVWAIVLNMGMLKIYSQAISQGLVACMLVWVVALGVGEGRTVWQTTLAASLAAVIALTRINMIPVILFIVPYIYWVHGRRSGLAAVLAGGGLLIIGHLIFWPGVLKLWAAWLPGALTPFLNVFRDQAGGTQAWQVLLTPGAKLGILKDSLRLHLVPAAGILWAWILVPSDSLKHRAKHPFWDVVVLSSLFIFLFLIHVAATLGKTYCPFCLKNYLAFFSPIGLIVLAIAGAHWYRMVPPARQAASLLLLLLVPWALGFSLGEPLARSLLNLDLPRLSHGAILPGTAKLGPMITGRFGLSAETMMSGLVQVQLAGLALLVVVGAILLLRGANNTRPKDLRGPALKLLSMAVVASLELGNLSFGTFYRAYDCGQDVIASQTAAGAHLASVIQPGSSIYWASGGQSPVPLLYLDQPSIFPPQLNGVYSYRYGGDSQALVRFGYWNSQLALAWLLQADYVLVDVGDYHGWMSDVIQSEDFDELTRTPPTNPCDPTSALLIFHRLATRP
jgi:hypothetical protein